MRLFYRKIISLVVENTYESTAHVDEIYAVFSRALQLLFNQIELLSNNFCRICTEVWNWDSRFISCSYFLLIKWVFCSNLTLNSPKLFQRSSHFIWFLDKMSFYARIFLNFALWRVNCFENSIIAFVFFRFVKYYSHFICSI